MTLTEAQELAIRTPFTAQEILDAHQYVEDVYQRRFPNYPWTVERTKWMVEFCCKLSSPNLVSFSLLIAHLAISEKSQT